MILFQNLKTIRLAKTPASGSGRPAAYSRKPADPGGRQELINVPKVTWFFHVSLDQSHVRHTCERTKAICTELNCMRDVRMTLTGNPDNGSRLPHLLITS
jgi:hypothetical protein